MFARLLELKDTRNVFWRVTLNVNRRYVCFQKNSTGPLQQMPKLIEKNILLHQWFYLNTTLYVPVQWRVLMLCGRQEVSSSGS